MQSQVIIPETVSMIGREMEAPHRPTDESQRLKSLHDLLILDSPPEERFDMLTAYAALYFKVPIALVSLVDENRQWFKSRCGLGASETSRDISFCGHAILSDDILMIRDTLADSRFADNPLVTSDPFIRFYAGAPLILDDGQRVGTFCLIDRHPRRLDAEEQDHLRQLAAVVAQELQGIDASTEFVRKHS